MRMQSLEAFGLPEVLLDVWARELGPELLKLQEAAVRAGLCTGRNLICLGPGSAGKTFVGELAAVRAALAGRKALYICPTKALAEQKFATIGGRLRQAGLRVVITTRDHCGWDTAILRGEFDIAVGVPEKFRALLAASHGFSADLGAVIVDELQVLLDAERGPVLELLVADLLALTEGQAQVVALAGPLSDVEVAAEWLGAEVVRAAKRPVDLRVGVLLDGKFRYVDYNTGEEGEESLGAESLDEELGWGGIAAGLALELARRGEPTIVFCRDKSTANALARRAAEASDLPEAAGLVDRLASLPSTAATRMLAELAAAGVAVHHADLQAGERRAVEAALEAGELGVVFATSTLAMGVNLPARNVIIQPMQWRGRGGGSAVGALPKAEFDAMAGRAGRLAFHDSFGRAILIAESELEADALMGRYVRAREPRLSSPLWGLDAEDVAVGLASCAAAAEAGLEGLWRRTMAWVEAGGRGFAEAMAGARGALERLHGAGLLGPAVEGFRPTPALRAAAAGAIDAATVKWLREVALRDGGGISWLDLLAAACTSPYMLRLPVGLGRGPGRDAVAAVFEWAEGEGLRSELLQRLLTHERLGRRQQQRAARMVWALVCWREAGSVEEAEDAVRMPAGRLEALAATASWLMQVVVQMGAELGWPLAAVSRLLSEARVLRRGPALADEAEATGRDARANGADKAGAGRVGEAEEAELADGIVLDARRPDVVLVCGRQVRVSAAEFRLLWRLARDPGAVVAKEALIAAVYGPREEWATADQLYSHVRRLRKKLAEAGLDGKQIIVTVRGAGVRLGVPAKRVGAEAVAAK